MGVPISILIDQRADGRFHATAPDHPDIVVDAETLDVLFQNLHARLSPIFIDGSATTGAGPLDTEGDDATFEGDLAYLLDKNAELYRRLAR